MYCYKCGNQLADNAAFCSHCGAAIAQTPQPAAPAQPQQSQWQPVPPQQAYQPAQGYSAGQAPVPPPSQAPIPAERKIYTAGQAQAPVQAAPVAAQPVAAPVAAPQPAPAAPPPQSAPTPPPVEAVSPAAVGLDNSLYSGISVVPKRNKTTMDMICGVVFLLLGILCMGIYGFAVSSLLVEGGLEGMFPVLVSFSDVLFLSSLLSLGYVFALVAGLLMALGGVFALISGRGRKPAYTGIVLMLFTLAFDVIYLLLMDNWGYLGLPIAETVMRSFFIYAFEVVFVLVPTVLLMLKKQAKKRARTTLVLQADDKNRKGKAQLTPPAPPRQEPEPVIPVPQEEPEGTADKPEAKKPAEPEPTPVGMDVPLSPPSAAQEAPPLEPEKPETEDLP